MTTFLKQALSGENLEKTSALASLLESLSLFVISVFALFGLVAVVVLRLLNYL